MNNAELARNRSLWTDFLSNEHLGPERIDSYDQILMITNLVHALAAQRSPKVRPHAAKLDTRRLIANTAMDLRIDLSAIKKRGKIAMGRGLLDVWNAEYAKRYGSNVGTASAREAKRRDIKTKLRRKQNESS